MRYSGSIIAGIALVNTGAVVNIRDSVSALIDSSIVGGCTIMLAYARTIPLGSCPRSPLVNGGAAVGIGAVALVDASRAIRHRGTITGGLINGGSIVVTVQLVNSGRVRVRVTPRIKPLIDGCVVMVTVLLVNSG